MNRCLPLLWGEGGVRGNGLGNSLCKVMNRREFLKSNTGALALAAFSPFSSLAADSSAKKRDFKKGIWYSAVPGKSPLERFKLAKEAGFDGVESPSHLDQDELLRARDSTGLVITTVSCGQHSRPLSHPDASKRAAAVEGIKQALRDAKRYGASSVLVVAGGVNAEISYADAYERTQAGLRQAVPLAEELGVKLAVENVWNHFLLSPLGVHLDTATIISTMGVS